VDSFSDVRMSTFRDGKAFPSLLYGGKTEKFNPPNGHGVDAAGKKSNKAGCSYFTRLSRIATTVMSSAGSPVGVAVSRMPWGTSEKCLAMPELTAFRRR